MPKPGKLKAVLQNLGLMLVSLVLLGIVAEVAARVFFPDRRVRFATDDELLFILEPNQTGILGEPPVNVRTNEAGLRGPSLDSLGERRVLFLGDSFVFGYQVEEHETFVSHINAALPEGVSAVNAGQGGFGIFQVESFADRLLPLIRPEVVVLVVWEGQLLRQPPPEAERTAVLARSAKIKQLKSLSTLGTHLYRSYERLALRVGAENAVVTLGHYAAFDDDTEDEFRAAVKADGQRIAALARRVEAAGAKFLLVHWPEDGFANIDLYPISREVAAGIGALANEIDVPHLNLEAALSVVPTTRLIVPNDGHPTALAHCLAARALAAEFGRLGWYETAPIQCEGSRVTHAGTGTTDGHGTRARARARSTAGNG